MRNFASGSASAFTAALTCGRRPECGWRAFLPRPRSGRRPPPRGGPRTGRSRAATSAGSGFPVADRHPDQGGRGFRPPRRRSRPPAGSRAGPAGRHSASSLASPDRRQGDGRVRHLLHPLQSLPGPVRDLRVRVGLGRRPQRGDRRRPERLHLLALAFTRSSNCSSPSCRMTAWIRRQVGVAESPLADVPDQTRRVIGLQPGGREGVGVRLHRIDRSWRRSCPAARPVTGRQGEAAVPGRGPDCRITAGASSPTTAEVTRACDWRFIGKAPGGWRGRTVILRARRRPRIPPTLTRPPGSPAACHSRLVRRLP